MRKKALWKRMRTLSIPYLKRPVSIMQIIRLVLGAIIISQIITVAVLVVTDAIRNRNKNRPLFPRLDFDEITVGDNKLCLYCYGSKLYDAMLEAIDSAKDCIYLETFIWKSDKVGQAFKDHLACKAAEGVKVYVIFDSFGNLVVPHWFKSPKSFHPSINVLKYQSIRRLWHIFDPRHYALDHRKLLAVDGSVAFIGGYNIGDLYATKWRDTHMCIRGPAAADIAQSFVDFWNRTCHKDDRITRHYPRRFDPLFTLWGNDALRLTFPIRDMYIENIDRAEQSIWLTNAYFVPDHILLDALKAAARRGVDVRVLVPWISNHVIVDWVSHGYFTECLQAGIRIFGYRYTMLHAKTCTIDGQWSTIGTANLDRLSSIGNFEINVEIYSAELAQQMQTLFNCDTDEWFELTLGNWRSRPWYTKLSERILAPLRFIS